MCTCSDNITHIDQMCESCQEEYNQYLNYLNGLWQAEMAPANIGESLLQEAPF